MILPARGAAEAALLQPGAPDRVAQELRWPTAMKTLDFGSWAMFGLLSALWGTAFLFTRIAVEGVPPVSLAALRVGLAAVLLNAVRSASGLPLPSGAAAWTRLVALSLSGAALPFALISWGQQSVSSGIAGVLMAVVPLAVILLAHFALPGEPLTRRRLGGFLMGFVGVLLLLGPGNLLADAGESLAARLAVLAGAGCYAVNAVLARRLPELHPIVYGAAVFSVAAVVLTPLALLVEQPFPAAVPARAWGSALWLGVGPTAVATIVHYRLVRSAGAGFASLVSYLLPVVALAAGALVLAEPVEPGAVTALVLILSGIAWSETGVGAACRAPPAPVARP